MQQATPTPAAVPPLPVLVLAAGASRRMGTPKQLLPLGTGTILTAVVETLSGAGCKPVVCVLGASGPQIEAVLSDLSVEIVHNPNWEAGEMLSSVQCGLRYLSETGTRTGCLVALGDQPGLSAATVETLAATAAADPERLVFCSNRLRRQHPIYLPRTVWARICELPVSATLRTVTGDPRLPVAYVTVESFGEFQDLDTPEQYDSYRAQSTLDTR